MKVSSSYKSFKAKSDGVETWKWDAAILSEESNKLSHVLVQAMT